MKPHRRARALLVVLAALALLTVAGGVGYWIAAREAGGDHLDAGDPEARPNGPGRSDPPSSPGATRDPQPTETPAVKPGPAGEKKPGPRDPDFVPTIDPEPIDKAKKAEGKAPEGDPEPLPPK